MSEIQIVKDGGAAIPFDFELSHAAGPYVIFKPHAQERLGVSTAEVIDLGMIRVEGRQAGGSELLGKGYADLLLRMGTREAIFRGATLLDTPLISPYVVAPLVRVFGEEAQFYEEQEENIIPLSAEDARRELKRLSDAREYRAQFRAAHNGEFGCISAAVDLGSSAVRDSLSMPRHPFPRHEVHWPRSDVPATS